MDDSPNDADALARAVEILGQVGTELAFVEPDRDAGLLPINSLVMDLEEFIVPFAPPEVTAAVAAARRWLDQALDGPGTFTQQSIQNFVQWHSWMMSALTAWERGAAPPALPPDWIGGPASAMTTRPEKPAAPPPAVATEAAIRLNLADDAELLAEFHGESLELLQSIEQGVLVLEQTPADAGTINSIFRAFHTFKGGAGFLHLDALRDLAHDLESLLDAVRRSDLRITSDIIDLILAGADALRQFTLEIGLQLQGTHAGAPIVVPTSQLLRRVRAALRGDFTPAPAPTPAPNPTILSPGPAPVSAPTQSTVATPIAPHSGASLPPNPTNPSLSPLAAPSPPVRQDAAGMASGGAGFVKLDTRKLDSLVDLVGELVIAQSMVIQNPDVQRLSNRQLARSLRQLGRITTELQRNAMSLRMVPVRGTFQKMTRLVRDLAAQQQKQVQLVLEGEETEVDRHIVEELADPLIHMIRNSADHGIESPEERVAQGKPPVGTIRITAAHQRGGIVIRIQDDGRGLDRDRILAKARERGLLSREATMSEAETFALIFAPGFSTADKVTDLSGRGVGMDVVRRNIEKLRGKVEIQSVRGQGTTLTLLLPLTLAIIDGLIVGLGDDRYIIPALSVRESFRPRPGMVSTVHERGEVVGVRGRLTPLLRLGDHLGTPARATDPTEGIIVVVESGDDARALLVDELIGKQEVVIKSLGTTFRRQNLLAGAAILGDGRVGLILDVDTLVQCRSMASDAPTLRHPTSSP